MTVKITENKLCIEMDREKSTPLAMPTTNNVFFLIDIHLR